MRDSSNQIKVWLDIVAEDSPLRSEHLWARLIAPGLAKLENVPVFDNRYGLWDLVKIGPDNKILELVEKCTTTQAAEYETEDLSDPELHERYRLIVTHLRSHSIVPEGMRPGLLIMSVPMDMDNEALEAVVDQCPVELSIVWVHE